MFVSVDLGTPLRKRVSQSQPRARGRRRCAGSGCARPAARTPASEVRRRLANCDRSFRPVRQRSWQGRDAATATRRDLGRALDLLAESPEGAAVRGRSQAAGLRAVRTGRALEGRRHELDPRPREWCVRRQPLVQPAHRLPELCGDVGHALRAETSTDPRGAGLPPLRTVVPASRRPPALLLPRVRNALGPIRCGAPCEPQSGQTSSLTAVARGSCDRLLGYWPPVWRH